MGPRPKMGVINLFNLKNAGLVLAVVIAGALAMNSYNSGNVAGEKDQVTLNWGQEVNAGKCVKPGKQVINVSQKVENSVDSGVAGNYWAFDNYNRTIQVWEQEGGTYCAVVRYQGKFDGQEGQTSPNAGGTLDGSEDGSFEGGYRATITGSLKSSPAWKRNGSIGTHNYNCDISGNCPGAVNWVDQYFSPGSSFAFDWWGWVYHAGNAGSWVNSVDGNSGDIL